MKRNKRAPERKLHSEAEIERRRKINAAIRHAEQVVAKTGVYEPVVYRPSPTSRSIKSAKPDGKRSSSSSSNLGNSAMGEAIRKALQLPANPSRPARNPPAKPPSQANGRGAPSPSALPGDVPTGSKADRSERPDHVLPQRRKLRTLEPQDFRGTAAPKKSKTGKGAGRSKDARLAPPKSKKKLKAAELAAKVVARKEEATRAAMAKAEQKKVAKLSARRRKEANDASRIAFNARLRAQREEEEEAAVAPSPFIKLQRDWNAAFMILLRYEDDDPNARNVLDARRRLSLIEAEWHRRRALKPGDPDYFPWPSTDIAATTATAKSAIIDRHERGMLGYVGYHVGVSSPLTAAQRARLLGQIFMMRLPPLNDLNYMASWGQPGSAARLRKIADSMASFVKTAKRRKTTSLDTAIGHWEADLVHMRRRYYDGHFDFQWPTI